MYNYPFLFSETSLVSSVYKLMKICYNIYVRNTEATSMKQKYYTPHIKKDDRVVMVSVDLAHISSPVHKYGALNNKSKVFDDRRKRKPKYKPNYMED